MDSFLVLGAGMVGVTTALELQARGHEVVLVDRRAPGCETSYGNAGVIQTEAAEPYGIPRSLRVLAAYAFGRSNDLVYDVALLPRMAPVLLQYFRNSAPTPYHKIAAIYTQLTARAADDHQPLITASGQEALIARKGYIQAYRTARVFDLAARGAERLRRDYGRPSTVLDARALRATEPAILRDMAGAICWTGAWTCSDPGQLTAGYAALFAARGGQIVQADALGLAQKGHSWEIATNTGKIGANSVVIALGPWSQDLLDRLGYRLRMVLKRGYHGHFSNPVSLGRPVMDVENGVIMSPMTRGLRLATGAALVARGARSAPQQLCRGIRAVSDMIDLGPRVSEPQWFGHRPCLPDMLPMVGRAPRHKGLWLNLGHGHQGFTLGPTTAKLLADQIGGRDAALSTALAPASRPRVLA